MRNEFPRLSWDELPVWAALVAQHWLRTQKNPTETECSAMVDTAREMVANDRLVLQ
jgi:hypothetical protein